MKIVVWNCRQKLNMKLDALLALNADIAIIPECANPSLKAELKNDLLDKEITETLWEGRNSNKGLGIFLFGNKTFQSDSVIKNKDQISIKCGISGAKNPISILAIWTQREGYVEKAHWAIDTYKEYFQRKDLIFAGDFNSNKMWDKSHRPNHSQLIERLETEFDLISVYHHFFKECQGSESRKTFFMRRENEYKGYHIDYIFLPKLWLSKIRDVSIGSFKEWGKLSDHCPLILTIDL